MDRRIRALQTDGKEPMLAPFAHRMCIYVGRVTPIEAAKKWRAGR
jgi:hypothetical protein